MEEVWIGIEGYDEYFISNLGRIRRYERLLHPASNGLGYLSISLRKNGVRRHFYIHRLVMLSFTKCSNDKLEVNHIDNKKSNNRLDNLEWVTHKENLVKAVIKLGSQAFTKEGKIQRMEGRAIL